MHGREWSTLVMQGDIRYTPAFREAAACFENLRQPGTGQISDAEDLHVAPDGRRAVFAGALMNTLEGVPATRICSIDLSSGDLRILTHGPNVDRLPKFSPDGRHVAFLSDRTEAGDFQLYILDPISGAARPAARVEGWVEYLHWSPDGSRILLGVAGHGADVAGGQGAITSSQSDRPAASWIPSVESGNEEFRWRRAWIFELSTKQVWQASGADTNVWEAVWCGSESIAAVVSSGPGEGLWYSAHLYLIDVASGRSTAMYEPRDQLGWPAASPSGERLAVVEAICSDRWLVAGDVRLIETKSGVVRPLNTSGVDVTYLDWRSEDVLLIAGHCDFATVVGLLHVTAGTFTEIWSSEELTASGRSASVAAFGAAGDCVLIGESFVRAPEIAVIARGEYRALRSLDLGYANYAKAIEKIERVRWRASDALEIHGWLLLPRGTGPHPLVMNIHGGPVAHWRPFWLGRRAVAMLLLVAHGCAVFFPNPRGSSGRGQDFARRVVGDMGGADTHDYLSGLNHLVERGIADATRLGVTGGSYGGFMTAWLITQDPRFAAAVAIAPVANQITEHLVSNIPHFVKLFLADHYAKPDGKYFQRSPVMHAAKARTPTLNVCGALDRCTPPEEAIQFHSALLENGVKSVLVTYPEEGHGVRKFPAVIDYTARIVSWFDEYLMRCVLA